MSTGQSPRRQTRLAAVVVVLVGGIIGTAVYSGSGSASAPTTTTTAPAVAAVTTQPANTTSPTATTAPPATTTTLPARPAGTVPGWTVGLPWGSTPGLTMFRGNPTRTYYGEGPLPTDPQIQWSYPSSGGMCGNSSVGGETKLWCGTGWTGQPVVRERPDGITEVIFGAYDKAVHFLDAGSGGETMPRFLTGDIIKGSVTLDPDGFPLLYHGSRDNKLRILALDRPQPTELWSLDAYAVQGIWNDDWDGNPVVIDDIMYEGGENGWFFAIKLNRAIGADGLVTVTPRVVFQTPGWTPELIAKVGRNVSIESSVMVHGTTAYFANSGGRVAGFDISNVESGNAPLVFDYWVGDDTDATLVSDSAGNIYVAVEEERKNARSRELGQLIKLDPTKEDPYVWGVPVPGGSGDGGLWATPALGDGVLYASTHPGQLLAVDTETGEVLWQEEIGWHSWSSPVIVGDELLVATCTGQLRAYSLADPRRPVPKWTMQLTDGCIESTPAVWKGRIYVGTRDGKFYAVG
jgi:outer membrane protein assembly factor BamB